MNPSDRELKEALSNYKKIAIIGLSHQSKRPSHIVGAYLQEHGYEICGIRPAGPPEILGRPRYKTLSEVPSPLEIVDVFRAPEHVPPIAEEAIRLGAKVLWLQEGVSHPEAEAKAREAGLLVVSDLCIKKAHARLFADSQQPDMVASWAIPVKS